MKEGETELDVWREKMQQDLNEVRQRQRENEKELGDVKKDIHNLQISEQLQDQKIKTLHDTLSEIKSDTAWIRRKITGALITAIITAIVGGIVGFAINAIYGG